MLELAPRATTSTRENFLQIYLCIIVALYVHLTSVYLLVMSKVSYFTLRLPALLICRRVRN